MLADPKFMMEELKTLFDEYIGGIEDYVERGQAKSTLYDFLFHLKEMTPEYRELIEQRDILSLQLLEVKRQLEKESEI